LEAHDEITPEELRTGGIGLNKADKRQKDENFFHTVIMGFWFREKTVSGGKSGARAGPRMRKQIRP
jgi:hypothetical protein